MVSGAGAQATPPAAARIDAELAKDLAAWAARLSGRTLPAQAPLPRFEALAPDQLAREVCPREPRGCGSLVAAYDTDRQRVLYRATLDMRDPTDQSFVVHELVHWLQHLAQGTRLEESCEGVLDAEREAYTVQNRYLAHFKQWQRVGDVLRFTFCPAASAGRSEPVVRYDASSGPMTAGRAPQAPASSASVMPPRTSAAASAAEPRGGTAQGGAARDR